MRLETLAVSKLMERMVNNGASLEELKKVADYMVTAAVYDEMTVNLYDVAEKNGIKELVKKYPPRFSWLGSSDTSAKELLNLNHGVPKHEYNFSKTKVGDKITVDLKELGKFEATAHEVTDNNVLFIFDNYIAERPMASAYALLDQSYKDYRRKLKELYGEEADQRIIEAIAVEKAEKVHIQASYLCSDCDISSDKSVGRPVLFYEEYSKRFFRATVEQVQNAEYHLNRNYALGGSVILNELYSFLGLSSTDFGEVLGWAPTDEGEYWIEFNHRRAKLKDGTEFYIIEMPFEPRVNYDDYYESEEEYYANNPNSPKLQML